MRNNLEYGYATTLGFTNLSGHHPQSSGLKYVLKAIEDAAGKEPITSIE